MPIEHFEKRDGLDSSLMDIILRTFDFDSEKKEIVSFCVVQLFIDGAESHEIIKYDTAHGVCHVHRLYRGSNSKELLFNRNISIETLMWCKKDILEKWRKYKRWFVERRLR
jgi:hypothetical protein